MKVFTIVPLDLKTGRHISNKEGDKRIKNLMKEHFNRQTVVLIHRSPSRKSLEELYSYRIVFLEDGDANLLSFFKK